ncbi:DUF6479 family protein [Streptomyces sp. NPDC086838]|uniref:DUF6479 family protein n=1 Tax=Streptomyces sp. NPDC086838 TaxID=3365762 RepID=UPI00381FA0F1
MNTSVVLAAGDGAPLLLITVGIVVVLVLLAAFVYGSRRSSRKGRRPVVGAGRQGGSGVSQHGETWQTIDDDPDQGNPRR